MFALFAWLPVPAGAQSPPDQGGVPITGSAPAQTPVSELFPGGGHAPPSSPEVAMYQGNPQHISEGKRLFVWYNCNGCHFSGGGGIGPALMDSQWIYGDRLEQIFASIYQGRPNGMPSWGGKIPNAQIWEIAAYVKALSTGNETSGTPAPVPPMPAARMDK